jgi:hypothetical protein
MRRTAAAAETGAQRDETMKVASYIRNCAAWRSPTRRASSTRDRIPSLAKTWRRCEFTVCAEM